MWLEHLVGPFVVDVFEPRRKQMLWSRPIAAETWSTLDDRFLVTCPYCGEQVEIYLEPDVTGSFVQDCEVCCNPWRVRVSGRGDAREIHITRADGSE